MNSLELVLSKYGCLERIEQSSQTIMQIEKQIGFILPEDYANFLIKFQGFEKFVGPEYMQIWDIDNLLENNASYEIIELLPLKIGIGSNMGGELIALEYIDINNYRIILTPFILFYEKENHRIIGDSFTDFLMRLDNNEKWFSQ
jgi:hypothetical protein